VPEPAERVWVDGIIHHELVHNELRPETGQRMRDVIEALRRRGAEGVVLGCTEIPLLIKQADVDVPLFDTLSIHVEAAVDLALA
jgi:aspartate racemase